VSLARSAQRAPLLALGALLVLYAALATSAMRRTSTTVDEILLPAAGARGFHTGQFNLVTDHPPLLQYLYGLPVALMAVRYPAEPPDGWSYRERYRYARSLYFEQGNDPEVIAFRARLVGVLIGALLVGAVYAVARSLAGAEAALLAAALAAFYPDVLAHSGVSYNDVPAALALLVAAATLDRAIRKPGMRRAALAGAAVGLAIATKFSAIALGPIAAILLALEVTARGRDSGWWRRILSCALVLLIAAYLVLVAAYQGDLFLHELRSGLQLNLRHIAHGHNSYLLGEHRTAGWWYFFPLVFFLKTPIALHLLLVIALVALGRALAALWRAESRNGPGRAPGSRAGLLESGSHHVVFAHPLRMPFVAGAVFLLLAMRADLNIGFRHALPIVPFACILIGTGVAASWRQGGSAVRALIAALLLWNAASMVRAWPWYLSYLGEYAGAEEDAYRVLADSSLDWGQGLIELRHYMRAHDIPLVYLSYFGSAPPDGYDIDYLPLPSYARLAPRTLEPGQEAPRYLAVSATNLAGVYLPGDPFAYLRTYRPIAVIAGSIWMFEVADESGR
jgi:hypothetical protein